jgi:hypothetical protein
LYYYSQGNLIGVFCLSKGIIPALTADGACSRHRGFGGFFLLFVLALSFAE